MIGMDAAALPYPLPEHWRLAAVRPTRWWWTVFWSALALANVVAAFVALGRADAVAALVYTVIFAAIGLGVAVAFERAGDEDALPEMLNAVVLSRAQTPPPDSWVHFFREARLRRWVTTWFALVGLVASVVFSWCAVLAVGKGGAWPWLLLLVVPLLLGALVIALVGVIAIIHRYRHASFGRRPIGLSLGRSGVIRYYLDDADEWPWDRIAHVRPEAVAVDVSTGDATPRLVVVFFDGDEYVYDLSGVQAHAWLVYTAVRFWAEHPAHRDELSTTRAQQRMEAWARAMRAAPTV